MMKSDQTNTASGAPGASGCRPGRRVSRSRLVGLGAALTAATLHLTATVSQAQGVAFPPDDSKPIGQWLCVVLFAGLSVAIAAKNPKRSHKD